MMVCLDANVTKKTKTNYSMKDLSLSLSLSTYYQVVSTKHFHVKLFGFFIFSKLYFSHYHSHVHHFFFIYIYIYINLSVT